jgi:hypothetical protein
MENRMKTFIQWANENKYELPALDEQSGPASCTGPIRTPTSDSSTRTVTSTPLQPTLHGSEASISRAEKLMATILGNHKKGRSFRPFSFYKMYSSMLSSFLPALLSRSAWSF